MCCLLKKNRFAKYPIPFELFKIIFHDFGSSHGRK